MSSASGITLTDKELVEKKLLIKRQLLSFMEKSWDSDQTSLPDGFLAHFECLG